MGFGVETLVVPTAMSSRIEGGINTNPLAVRDCGFYPPFQLSFYDILETIGRGAVVGGKYWRERRFWMGDIRIGIV